MKKVSKFDLYLNALSKNLNARKKDIRNKDLLKQNIFYLVKTISKKGKPLDYKEAQSDFQMISATKMMIEQITPSEFMNLFPIKKSYNGDKYGVKDFNSTMRYINSLERDKPIENAMEFMFSYHNDDIQDFLVKLITTKSYINMCLGQPSVAEIWAGQNGIETYTKHTDQAGSEYLLDSKGKTRKIEKKRHLHLVK